MSAAILKPRAFGVEQRFVVEGVGYDAYESIDEALGEKPALRLIFVDGRLTLMTTSRRHEWFAERLAELVKVVASASGIGWEDAGSATFRRREKEVGVEGDKTFYLGENARRMRGPVDIDLETQPPPDLAIEVEVTHPADDALLVYGRLGVPEVWCIDVESRDFTFRLRREDGTYAESDHGPGLPRLTAADVLGRMKLAESTGADAWCDQLRGWVRDTLLARDDVR